MTNIKEDIANLKATYQTLKNDFDSQKNDLYLLKKHAQFLLTTTSNYKMSETINFSDFNQKELVELLAKIRNLIRAIEKEIEIQNKEDFYQSPNSRF